jgi:hypothetical protein
MAGYLEYGQPLPSRIRGVNKGLLKIALVYTLTSIKFKGVKG